MNKGISPDDVATAFQEFDEDGNGLIDGTEASATSPSWTLRRILTQRFSYAHPRFAIISLDAFDSHGRLSMVPIVCAYRVRLSCAQFSNFITKVLKLRLSRSEMSQIWRSLDVDGLGAVDFAEFSGTLFPEAAAKAQEEAARAEAEEMEISLRRRERERPLTDENKLAGVLASADTAGGSHADSKGACKGGDEADGPKPEGKGGDDKTAKGAGEEGKGGELMRDLIADVREVKSSMGESTAGAPRHTRARTCTHARTHATRTCALWHSPRVALSADYGGALAIPTLSSAHTPSHTPSHTHSIHTPLTSLVSPYGASPAHATPRPPTCLPRQARG